MGIHDLLQSGCSAAPRETGVVDLVKPCNRLDQPCLTLGSLDESCLLLLKGSAVEDSGGYAGDEEKTHGHDQDENNYSCSLGHGAHRRLPCQDLETRAKVLIAPILERSIDAFRPTRSKINVGRGGRPKLDPLRHSTSE
jgi:hypothetical protein